MDKDRTAILARENAERLAKENVDAATQIESSIENTALIFAIFKFKPDTIIEVNPNITITATNIHEHPKLKNLEYAVQLSLEGMKEVNPKFQFTDKSFETQINAKTFIGYNSSITIDNMSANYESYLGNYGDFNLLITISYKNEVQKNELLEIVKRITTSG